MSGADVPLRSARGRGVLLASVLGSGMAFLDTTVVNVALPTLARDLGAGLAGLQWTLDAYLLTLGGFLLLGGALGDRFGRRRVFVWGLVAFAGASALCGLAPDIATLVAARALQGLGAALLTPGSLALLRSTFSPQEQHQAVGAWAGLSGVSTAVGPLLGGWLIEAVSWRLVFLINLPLAAVAVWAARRFVPESRGGAGGALDLTGALLAALGLGGLLFALIEAGRDGLPPVVVAGMGLAGLLLLGLFLVWERRAPSPMLPLSLFRSRRFSGANATTLVVYFALGGATFLLTLQLQQGLGYSPLQAGAALLPITLLLLVLSPAAGRLAARVGDRLPMSLGPLGIAVGLALLAGRVRPGADYLVDVLPGVGVFGLGLSLTVAPLTSAVISGVDEQWAGIASAVNNAVARIAGLLAVAVLPLVGGMGGAHGLSQEALVRGVPVALWLCAALCVAGAAVAFLTVEDQEPPAARRRP